ncbi:MAG: ABC transporter permease [Planctomycetota bacterium]|jgi:hypothetical protein
MESLQSPWPFWKVQVELSGGFRRVFIIAAVFAGASLLVFEIICRLANDTPRMSIASYLLTMLMSVQPFFLLLGGCNAVYRACLRDYDTKMIESHRVSPSSSYTVVLGYLLGSTVLILSLSIVACLISVGLLIYTGSTLSEWLRGYVLFVSTAMMAWSFSIFIGVRQEKPINPAGLLVGGMFSGVFLVSIPGLTIITGLGQSVAAIMTMTGDRILSLPEWFAMMGANFVLTIYWVYVSATKYRRPDLPVLNGWRGLAFLAIWLITAAITLNIFQDLNLNKFDLQIARLSVQWLVTLVTTLLLASVVVICTRKSEYVARTGIQVRGSSDRMGPRMTIALCSVIICAIMALLSEPVWSQFINRAASRGATMHATACWTLTFLVCVITLGLVSGLAGIFATRIKHGGKCTLALVAIIAAAPLVISLGIEQFLSPSVRISGLIWLKALSPIGTLDIIWQGDPKLGMTGLIIQAAMAWTVLVVSRRIERRSHATDREADTSAVAETPAA